jgi:hypothetical protein
VHMWAEHCALATLLISIYLNSSQSNIYYINIVSEV